MKTLSSRIFLIGFAITLMTTMLNADWLITQYHGAAGNFPVRLKIQWIVTDKDMPYGLTFATAQEMIIKFKEKKTGKWVIISPPFSIEEL